jgi:hypothetical protein
LPEIATDLNQPEILGATVWASHTTSDAHLGAVSTENLIALRLVAAVWVYSVATANNTAEHIVKHWLLFLLLNFTCVYKLADLFLRSLYG